MEKTTESVYDSYSVDQLKLLSQAFESEAMKLLERHTESLITQKKKDYFDLPNSTESDRAMLNFQQGMVAGLDFFRVTKESINAELKGREEGLQKDKKVVQ